MLWKIFGNVKTFLDKCRIDNITAFAAQSAFFYYFVGNSIFGGV